MQSKFTSTLILVMFSGAVIAETTLEEVAAVLMQGGGILQKLMWAACIIIGIMLIAAAFTQFQIHRRNPKLVPLATPVMYLILGIVAIAIPFIDTISGFMGERVSKVRSSPDQNPNSPQRPAYNPNDIDSPMY